MKNSHFHLSLNVSDIDRSKDFYDKLFGHSADKVKNAYLKYELNDPPLVISFVQQAERTAKQFGHLGFRVDSDALLQETKNRLQAHGLQTLDEENTTCCYARQDKFWVNDPDGYEWEVYRFLEDVEADSPASDRAEKAACCPDRSGTACC